MKIEQQQLYKILSKFEGMNKLDAFDLLQKMEVLLFYANSPLKKKEIKEIIMSDLNTENDIYPFQFSILPNGNFCEFVASNDWIQIYKQMRRGLGRLSSITLYYFKTKYAPLELVKLTHKNLLENVNDTDQESNVHEFLNKHRFNLINQNSFIYKLLDI